MAPLAGRLPGRRHLLIDLPGDGLSPPYLWQGAPVREQAVNVIAGVLDGLGIDQIVLVGNSLGGLFGLWFALDRPSRVARAVLVGQPAVAIAGSRANLTMVVLAAPVLGRVATWMARLPSPRLTGRLGLRDGAGAHAVRSVSDDIVDLHLLSMRLPGQAASFRSLLRRLLDGRTPRPENILTDAELASFTVPVRVARRRPVPRARRRKTERRQDPLRPLRDHAWRPLPLVRRSRPVRVARRRRAVAAPPHLKTRR